MIKTNNIKWRYSIYALCLAYVLLGLVACESDTSSTTTSSKNPEDHSPPFVNGVYELSTWQHIVWISDNQTRFDKHYKLVNDIQFPNPGEDGFSQYGLIPIGYSTSASNDYEGVAFSGTFDGNNHTIRNVYIDATHPRWNVSQNYIGLFGVIEATDENTVSVKNLTLQLNTTRDLSINSKEGDFVGALAGSLEKGKIENIVVTQTQDAEQEVEQERIWGRYSVGGIAGTNHATVHNVSSNSTVKGEKSTGGLVGYNSASIKGYFSGTVIGGNQDLSFGTGGLVGYNSGTVTGYATGTVRGVSQQYNVGGLVGYNAGTVIGYATNSVEGYLNVGGLVGYNAGLTVGYAAATIKVIALYSQLGGIVGENHGDVIGYTTSIFDGSSGDNKDVAGVVGKNSPIQANIIELYWNAAIKDTSIQGPVGTGVSDGIIDISNTSNLIFENDQYKDSGNNNLPVFNADLFSTVFNVGKGANATWPQLNTQFTFTVRDKTYTVSFEYEQPTISQ